MTIDPFTKHCEHGKRYCEICGTIQPEPPKFSAAVWTDAHNRIQAGKESAKKKESKKL